MDKLNRDWFAEGLIDFEYKKYVLLAYLKKVHQEFDKTILYPSLEDVLFHYRNLKNYLKNKSLLSDEFPQKISKEDLGRLKLTYKKLVSDGSVIEELQQISEFAISEFKNTLNTGTELYDFAESQLSIEPIGISPMYLNEGYVFTLLPPGKKLDVYNYKISLFENNNESYRGLMLQHIETRPYTLTTTLENMKINLIKRFRQFPNPATYAITSNMKFPYENTFLPIAKRLLVRNIVA